MFSKRPRRDKILVALTAFTAAAAIAVPLGLVFGRAATAAPSVAEQPADYSATSVKEYEYGTTPEAEPAPPPPLNGQYRFLKTESVVTNASDPAMIGKAFAFADFKPFPDAGTIWETRYVYAPLDGLQGRQYVYSIKNSVVPKKVTPLAPIAFVEEDIVLYYGFEQLPQPDWQTYQAAWLLTQGADAAGFLEQEGYQAPVFAKAQRQASIANAAMEDVALENFKTVPASYKLVATYELRTDKNHSGDPSVLTIEYAVQPAKITTPPPPKFYSANLSEPDVTKRQQIEYKKTPVYANPNDDPALTAALRAAKYKDYVRSGYPRLTNAPSGYALPAGVVINGLVTTDQAVAALPPGSTILVEWVAQHDDVNDPNYTGSPAKATYVYTVVKGNFEKPKSETSDPNDLNSDLQLDFSFPPNAKTTIDISESTLPSQENIFDQDKIEALKEQFVKGKRPRVLSFYLLKSVNQDKSEPYVRVPVTTIAELRASFKNNSSVDNFLYVELSLPFDWDYWNFEGKNEAEATAAGIKTDYTLKNKMQISNNTGI